MNNEGRSSFIAKIIFELFNFAESCRESRMNDGWSLWNAKNAEWLFINEQWVKKKFFPQRLFLSFWILRNAAGRVGWIMVEAFDTQRTQSDSHKWTMREEEVLPQRLFLSFWILLNAAGRVGWMLVEDVERKERRAIVHLWTIRLFSWLILIDVNHFRRCWCLVAGIFVVHSLNCNHRHKQELLFWNDRWCNERLPVLYVDLPFVLHDDRLVYSGFFTMLPVVLFRGNTH